MNFLKRLAFSGVHSAITPAERRSILLSNIVSLILFVSGITLFIAYYLWFGWNIIAAAIPVVTVLTLSTIFLNHIRFSIGGRILLTLLIPVSTMVVSIYAKQIYYRDHQELNYFTFRFLILGTCVFPVIFFPLQRKKYMISTLFAGLLILMLYDPLHNYFGVPYKGNMLKEPNYYFTNVVVFIAWSVLVSAVIFLKKVSGESEEKAERLIDELNRKNNELIAKNSEIRAQNLDILGHAENLNLSQKKLQDAYQQIADQKKYILKENYHLSSELTGLNNDLANTNNELVKHNNELRQFSYTVSHNLQGPLGTLNGLISIIDEKTLGDANAEIFTKLKASAERLQTIIKDLTKIIDIRQDMFHIRQKVRLKEETEHILEALRKETEASNAILKTDFSACDEIYSVRPMVHSILYNLLTNALKYRAPDRRPEISIIAKSNDKDVIIEILDNGLGIDLKNQKQNLFKLYRRFHYHIEGKGLGLYLVKLQAEALGGNVDVQSELNRFTKFTVTLPKPDNVEQQVLYHSPNAKIFYDASINAVGVVWNGPVTGEQYRNVFQNCLEFVKAYNTPNYISDLTKQGYISRDDQGWMFRNIMPEAVKHGLKKIAGIRAENHDPELQEYYSAISENLKKLGVTMKFFSTYKEAAHWLAQQNEKSLHEAGT